MVLHFKINITNQEGFDQNFNMTIKALLQRQFFLPKSHFNYDLIFNYTTLKRFRYIWVYIHFFLLCLSPTSNCLSLRFFYGCATIIFFDPNFQYKSCIVF